MTTSTTCRASKWGEPGAGGMDDDALVRHVTLLELVTVVSEYARSEAELLASVVYMVRRS